uniref:Uncharacterized protein n=1 Tax=Anopheles christyi TaxID=43041 RepID=A0A182JWA8_9DIPT
MQKHAERTDKRPPIGTRSSSSTVNLSASTPGSSNSSSASNGATTTVGPATMTGESAFWPKVSPDSAAATINDVINQQQNNHHEFSLTPNGGSATNGSNGSSGNTANGPQSNGGAVHGTGTEHSGAPHHQRDEGVDELTGGARGPQPDNTVVGNSAPNAPNGNANTGPQAAGQQQQQPPPQQQQQHNGTGGTMNGNLAHPPVSTPMSYDANSIAKATSNSAFTPINAMPPHLNSLQHHHQLASQRPSYLYDAISFQNQKAAMAQSPSNAFPNQLISLHQIRNYAHQPAGGLMAGDHLLGVTVGPGGKDKG